MRKLLSSINKRLTNEKYDCLPIGLLKGKLGICLFLSVYSKTIEVTIAGKRAQVLLQNIWKELMFDKNKYQNDCRETVYTLRHLEKLGLFHKDQRSEQFFMEVDVYFNSEYFFMPIQWKSEEKIFIRGLYVLTQRKNEDSLERYTIDETLISLIDHCERLLTSKMGYNIYDPQGMPLSLLHSIVYFLKEMEKIRIYPFKEEKLLGCVPEIYSTLNNYPPLDNFLYHLLMSNGKEVILEPIKNEKHLIPFLGSIGFYSFLYHNPYIFNSAWEKVKILYPNFYKTLEKEIKTTPFLSMDGLCGIGYGLLSTITSDEIQSR